MLNRLKKTPYLIILVLAIAITTTLSWGYFFTNSQANCDNQQLWRHLLQYANTAMTNDNYACAVKPVKTVVATMHRYLN